MNQTDRDTIRKNAAEVAQQHRKFEDARDASEDAAAVLLREVIEEAAPAFPALCSLVPSPLSTRESPATTDLRGVVVARRDDEQLVWTESGALALFDLGNGTWEELTDVAAVEEFGEVVVAQVAHSVRVAIDGQLRGGKLKSVRRMERRAAMLRSVAVLVANLETTELDAPEEP